MRPWEPCFAGEGTLAWGGEWVGGPGSLWSGPSIVQEAKGRTLVELCQPPAGPPSPHPCPLPGSADLLALTLPLCSAPAPPHPRLGSAHPAQVPGLPCPSGTSLLSPCSLPCWPSVGRAWVTSSKGPPWSFWQSPCLPGPWRSPDWPLWGLAGGPEMQDRVPLWGNHTCKPRWALRTAQLHVAEMVHISRAGPTAWRLMPPAARVQEGAHCRSHLPISGPRLPFSLLLPSTPGTHKEARATCGQGPGLGASGPRATAGEPGSSVLSLYLA